MHYLDIHYMDNYKVFTFSPQNYSKPSETIAQLKKMGYKVVVHGFPAIAGVKVNGTQTSLSNEPDSTSPLTVGFTGGAIRIEWDL